MYKIPLVTGLGKRDNYYYLESGEAEDAQSFLTVSEHNILFDGGKFFGAALRCTSITKIEIVGGILKLHFLATERDGSRPPAYYDAAQFPDVLLEKATQWMQNVIAMIGKNLGEEKGK